MAVLRKNYLKIGGHKWRVSFIDGDFCRVCNLCGVYAIKSGAHGKCNKSKSPE